MPGNPLKNTRLWYALALATAGVVGASAGQQPPPPSRQPAGGTCRVEGRVTSGREGLPGASVVVHVGSVLKAATSTDIDGRYTIVFSPNATYHLSAELTAFAPVERDLTLGPPPCDTKADFELALRPRRETAAQPQTSPEAGATADSGSATQGGFGRGRGGAGRGFANSGRGTAPGQNGQRFQTLGVQADANGEATLELAPVDDAADASRLLPAGFSLQNAQADAVAISGSTDATNVDRGFLNDRNQAIALGQLDPTTGQFAPGAAQPFGGDLAGGPQGQFGPGGGGFGGRGGGPGGGGGRGGFQLGGRGARGQSPYQGTATYTFGGSVLDTPPFQVNPNVPATQPHFGQNTFGSTFGGPLKIPGIYKDTNRRTNFQLNYTGNRSNNVFDQYATVPPQAMRNGDFSGSAVQVINPRTGQPFPNNQIPVSQMDPAALYLMGFIPLPNVPGTSNNGKNYHVSTTATSSSDAFSLRLQQNLSPTVQANGRGGFQGRGGGGGFGGGRGGFGGRGGGRGTNINLQAQLQYRRNETEALNVFPNLGSRTTSTSVAMPITVNVVKNRFVNNFTVNVTHSSSETTNSFANVQNVGGSAGIAYPTGASTSPQYWGVPSLSFAGGLTGVQGAPASVRTDTRITTSYTWMHPFAKHQLRLGADYRLDRDTNQLNVNAPGAFTFTGLYSGAPFADFLLGTAQQASLQVGGVSELRGKSFDTYIEDNWQKSSKLTFNLGLRYELFMPYTDANGHLVNLDVAPGFLAVAPVLAGAGGPFTGAFPSSVINTDANNIGPRIGVAFRPVRGTVIRTGYSITYNQGSYATIARRLASQPQPGFDETETVIGTATAPLTIEDALLQSTSTTTNNWGVDKNYQLGLIQTWNASISRDLTPIWTVLVGYTGTKGSDLDLLNAPNRTPFGGLLVPTVQPFTWETSGGRSMLNLGTVQITKRLSHGVGGNASYTFMQSKDDTPSLGGGGVIVAQNPLDPEAEYALSNFDRRHQFTGNFFVELPFGPGRRWLDHGGLLSTVVGGWTATLAWSVQSGTPFTMRVCGAAFDVAQGTNCSLRADLTGLSPQLSDPSLLAFFNTAAFSTPPLGTYGDSPRNFLIGPGSDQLNATLIRDIRLGGTRNVTLQINATNLLNNVQWLGIDTNPTSGTYGQVISVRPMRAATASLRFRF
jgi:trimeric autotransporter adhesin